MEYTRLKVMSHFFIGNWSKSTGHLALLIQQPDDTWAYYSVNGDKIYASANGKLGGPTNDVGVGSWESPEEFLKYMNGNSTQDNDGQTEEMTKYEYAEAYEITTTPEQDKIIADEFGEIAKEDYDLASNNCAHAVLRSLNAAGLVKITGANNIKPVIFMPSPYEPRPSIITDTHLAQRPREAYNDIKRNNSGRTYYAK